jgi:hypothetical protein
MSAAFSDLIAIKVREARLGYNIQISMRWKEEFMKVKERFTRELVLKASRNLYRTERSEGKERATLITASTKSAREIRAAFKHASLKLKNG